MNVLVTGGAGYVGGALTDILRGDSRVHLKVYDNLLYEDRYLKDVPFVFGDVLDREKLLPLLRWADAVVWLAAIVGDGACAVDPARSCSVNEASVRWLAENFNGRIVFPSTCSVYGARDGELDEESPTNPLSVYASTKLEAEKHLLGKNSIVFRLGTLFGVGDRHSRVRMDLVVNTMTMRAHQTGGLTVFGGDQFRPILHVRTIAKWMSAALHGGWVGTYNLHRQNVRISDLAVQVRNHFPDTVIEHTPMLFEDTRNYRVSSRKAEVDFCYVPFAERSIDDGIEEVKSILRDGRLKDPMSIGYSNCATLKSMADRP